MSAKSMPTTIAKMMKEYGLCVAFQGRVLDVGSLTRWWYVAKCEDLTNPIYHGRSESKAVRALLTGEAVK